jgi:hypothetical protein
LRYIVFVAALAIGVGGCATPEPKRFWVKRDYDATTFKRDHYECLRDASRVVPGSASAPMPAPAPGFFGGFAAGMAQAQAARAAEPQIVRDDKLLRLCMEARGYQHLPEAEAAAVLRGKP